MREVQPSSAAEAQRVNYPIRNDVVVLRLQRQTQPLLGVGRGLQHFNDADERARYAAHCRREREAALARWKADSNFADAGEADFWLLELLQVGER